MANIVLACLFAGRGIYHFIDGSDMIWWDIFMVIFNIILSAM